MKRKFIFPYGEILLWNPKPFRKARGFSLQDNFEEKMDEEYDDLWLRLARKKNVLLKYFIVAKKSS